MSKLRQRQNTQSKEPIGGSHQLISNDVIDLTTDESAYRPDLLMPIPPTRQLRLTSLQTVPPPGGLVQL